MKTIKVDDHIARLEFFFIFFALTDAGPMIKILLTTGGTAAVRVRLAFCQFPTGPPGRNKKRNTFPF